MSKRVPKLFASSVDDSKIALTWKGVMLALVPIVIALAQQFNLPLAENQIMEFIEASTALISGVTIVWGMIRKVYNALSNVE